MREYSSKKDVQKKSYFTDRFYVTPSIPKLDCSEDEVFLQDIEELKKVIEIQESYIQKEHLVIYVSKTDIVKTMRILRDTLEYDMLIELSAIDYIAQKSGFEIFYELLSISKHKRLRVKTFIKEGELLDSVCEVFKSANWSEREMYDMFGIRLINHPNLKRILMPDDWYDYPLKKTYPLQGDEVASWYEVDKIFGKESRDIIGPEQRDSARIDRYDTQRFARLGFEVPYGEELAQDETSINYQEKGISKIMKKLDPNQAEILEKRR